ncbi:MAG: transglycosylase SLT domain-containing protein [Elusimicrobiota bacterium]|jgi:soluble lytic murein transglycosylase-like protein
MTLLAFVAVFLVAPADAGVQVAVSLAEKAPIEDQSRVNATETLLKTILGESCKKDRVPGDAGAYYLFYSAPAWNPQVSKEDFVKIVVALKTMWAERIDFSEAQEGSGGQGGAVEARLKLPDMKGFAARSDAALKPGGFGTFFDGSVLGTSLNFEPAESLSPKKPGFGLDPDEITFSPIVQAKGTEPPPPGGGGHPYDAIITREAGLAGLDPKVLKAVVVAKGGYEARENRRSGNAHGVMLITKTAAAHAGMKNADLNDAAANIRVGARLLAELIDQFRGDTHRALAAYQVGAGAVIKSGGIPNDPEVKYFLAAYERALRGKTPKPVVEPVKLPDSPNLRRVREEAGEKVREKAEEVLSPTGMVLPRDAVSKYRKTIRLKAEKYGVDPWLVESVMRAENPWGDAMRESRAGAIGLMQLMPSTAKILKVNPRDPVQNIDGGVRHLKYLLGLFEGNYVLVVAAYNAGENAIDNSRIPNYSETKGYVVKVFGYYEDLTGEKVDPLPYMPVLAKRKTKSAKA